ncbi:MAG: DUF1186 domain-containing protein [Moorea sp. SIO2B7]|nr:DUF1186 domain-containing protein [Moorena sp. SIO2B7]
MSISDYQFPVSELLNYGECSNYEEWRNYVQELNFEEQHIPELIRMATDEELNQADSDSKEVWSPLHAWRALGQLKAMEALEPLLGLLNKSEDDDCISGDFAKFCSLIGLESIPLLKIFLADSSNNLYARVDVAEALTTLSQNYPETRESNIAAITQELKKYRDNDPSFNSLLIDFLVDLQAVEEINLIEEVFKANQVDTSWGEDWEDIQVEFGIKTRDEVTPRRFSEAEILDLLLASSRKNKAAKGFGSTLAEPTNKKTSKSSRKRKSSRKIKKK